LLVARIAESRFERELEELERALVIARLGVRDAEVVVERSRPVWIALVEPAMRPLLLHREVVDCDRAHVCGVAGEVPLVRLGRTRERVLEERKRGLRVTARPEHAAALELETDVRRRVAPSERLGLVEELRAALEVGAQRFDPRELRQHLRTTRVGRLLVELRAQPLLARVE